MRLFIIIIQIFILVILISCNTKNVERNDLIGNWYSLNSENGYIEYVIDTNEISVFSHYYGNRGIQPYTFNNDTLKFISWNYSVNVEILTDTSMVLSINNLKDTLFALPTHILNFSMIHYQSDTIFAEFYREFELRARNARDLHGYVNTEDYDKQFIDTIETEEILINRE
ncbi:MAG: hypothetical protein K0B15_17145 [Lentimicrobium sp.]|nr:hypothetical protein [Lentimicrobium sp.]